MVQYESLHRLALLPNVATLVVLDESESIIAQADNKNAPPESWQKFEWLMRNAARVIAMDAYAESRTYELLLLTRPHAGILMQVNEYRPPVEDARTDSYYARIEAWMQAVYTAAYNA